jgi:hypothetical protein
MWQFNGKHLVIDALCGDNKALLDSHRGNDILQGIVMEIDMTMILPPVTVEFPHAVCEMTRLLKDLESEGLGNCNTAVNLRRSLSGRVEQAYGYSTFLMIAESHLSIHTFPEQNYLTFDCYSCKDFNHAKVVELLTEGFKIVNSKINLIERANPGPA